MTDPPHAIGAGEDAVASLLAGQLDALFWRPTRLGVDSAWYGHLPFAHWIVAAARPRLLVELGTHAGVSYAAFCEAVQRMRLDTSCVAVDTWKGDEHAGFYGEDIYRDLQAFHDARYAGFSRLLRSDFDGALAYVGDASVDLLHIDGRHTYEDVRHDYESWRPKLSDRAVVLFHDINVRERGFGVWRLWAELSPGFAHFSFLHAYGLGVLCVGEHAPAAVRALCELTDPAAVARLRERFSLLGERWVLDHQQRDLNMRIQRDLAIKQAHIDLQETKFAEMAAYAESLQRIVGQPPARAELRSVMARVLVAEQQRSLAQAHSVAADARAAAAAADAQSRIALYAQSSEQRQHETDVLRAELDAILGSRSWAIAGRLRGLGDVVRGARRHPIGMRASIAQPSPAQARSTPPEPPPSSEPASAAECVSAPADAEGVAPLPLARRPRVLFAAGEPLTPGCVYRCVRNAEAAATVGWQALWKPVEEVGADDLRDTDLVVLWRVTWSAHVEGILDHVEMLGGRVALDLDDLMIRPDLARVEFIDAIRSINWSEAHVRAMFTSIRHVLHRVDFCIATTAELAAEMRRYQKAAYVLANGFDAATWRRSRQAARARAARPEAGLVRIGYAGGSRTHQRDFAAAAEAIAAVLRARDHTRLVLFRSGPAQEGLVSPDEYPALAAMADQIEWRDLVDLPTLPDELARFDINIVPLQVGNPFVEAKSELKFFEASIAGVPTVASPTGPYRRVIQHGETGFLVHDTPDWEQALLRLVDEPGLRQRMARAACADVLWRFGPERQAAVMRSFLAQHAGGPRTSDARALATSFALDVALTGGPASRPRSLLPFTPVETLFAQDQLQEAAVTIVLTVYNYADFLLEALESVRLQTLDLLDLVVVDDCSTDAECVTQVLDWSIAHASRLNRVIVLRHMTNAGLGAARNTGFAWSETPYVLVLDADNRLQPHCAARLLAALDGSGAAYAYPKLQQFDASDRIVNGERYEPQRLVGGNYIDAMALVARWAWSAAGGYFHELGWEDYDLWCRMAELGFWGEAVDAVLADYRVHDRSMTVTSVETAGHKEALVDRLESRHPWLGILARNPHARA